MGQKKILSPSSGGLNCSRWLLDCYKGEKCVIQKGQFEGFGQSAMEDGKRHQSHSRWRQYVSPRYHIF
jgi:hypothetical protein